jgi:hypothetical protein
MSGGSWDYTCKCHSYKKSTGVSGGTYGKIASTGTIAGNNFVAAKCDLCPTGCLTCSDEKDKCFYPCD